MIIMIEMIDVIINTISDVTRCPITTPPYTATVIQYRRRFYQGLVKRRLNVC